MQPWLVRQWHRTSLFYGWVIVCACGIIILCSSPGQSFGVAVFTNEFLHVAQLSRTEFSVAWAGILFCVSMLLPLFGRLSDSIGTRRLLRFVFVPFVCCVAGLSLVRGRVSLIVTLFLVRLLGPGVLVLIATTTVNKWFVAQRGRAASALNLIVALETAYPTVAIYLRSAVGSWRRSFWAIAGTAALSLSLSAVCVFDTPESVALQADGANVDAATQVPDKPAPVGQGAEPHAPPLEGVTVAEAMRFPVFWALSGSIGLSAFFWTGVNLHSIAVFKSHGLPETAMAHAYLLATVFTLVSTAVAGLVIDMLHTKKLRVMSVSLFFGALANGALVLMESQSDALVFGALYGVFAGTLNTCTMVCFADLFGRAHVGAINGVITMLFQGMGGFGPLSFALVADKFGGVYDTIFWFNALAMSIFSLAIFFIPWQRPTFDTK